MKQKWVKLFAFLGITTPNTTAEGVFMTEAEVDKAAALQAENETLKTEMEQLKADKKTADDALATAKTANEKAITDAVEAAVKPLNTQIETLTADKKTAEDKLVVADTKIAKLEGRPAPTAKGGDPDPTGKNNKKMSANEKAALKNAKALFGGGPEDEEEEEEGGEGAE